MGLALAGVLALCGALAGMPAQAFEPPPGGKNFTPPSSVPNYFSNEAAPFGRGSQTATPAADRFNIAPVAASKVQTTIAQTATAQPATAQPARSAAASAGRATYRGKLARNRTGRIKSASSRTAQAHVRTAHVSKAHVRNAYVRRVRGRPAHAHRSAKVASRHSVATGRRAAAIRSRLAVRGARHVRQASR